MKSLAAVTFLLSFTLFLPVQAQNADLPFDSGSQAEDGDLVIPTAFSGRYGHAMVFDEARNELVLFGGQDVSAGTTVNDTWTWNGTGWARQAPENSPPERMCHAMAYDAVRGEVVLFGGRNSTNGDLRDTWVWNGTTWAQKAPAVSPSTRYDHAMAFDRARGEIVLFGGYNDLGGETGDTWVWNGFGWSQKSPVSAPDSRARHGLVFDAARNQIVLFGGYSGSFGYSADTWTWNGTTWTERTPGNSPSPRDKLAMAYDAADGETVLFGGYDPTVGPVNDTWAWRGTNWVQKSSTSSPAARYSHSLAFDGARNQLVLAGGHNGSSETWVWQGSEWSHKAGRERNVFDMRTRPDGIWKFGRIFVPQDHTVVFLKNAGNTPVQWLARDEVLIEGTLNLSGEDAPSNENTGDYAEGGPGGFAGGVGGIRFDVSGSYAGTPGQGPGGGAPGVEENEAGENGTFRSSYGNVYLQPLTGGSGGGGGASMSQDYNGGNGGGGGGAILIASSRDIVVTGRIIATGGYPSGSASYGGSGSGGAVRLVADRVLGDGTVNAGTEGRVRIEGYYRPLVVHCTPVPSASAPVAVSAFPAGQTPALAVTNVAGNVVPAVPGGSLLNPDVIFTQTGPVTIMVAATNVPEGTPVTLRITSDGTIINVPAVNLSGGTATFTTTVPQGLGTIQALSTYTVQP